MAGGWLHAVRQEIETGLVRLGLATLPRLPRTWLVKLAFAAGDTAYVGCRRLRRLGLANLDLAFGARVSRYRKRAILRRSFRTFALMALDLFWFSRQTAERLRRAVRLDDSFAPLKGPEPIICLSAHLGNWELLGRALAAEGWPLVSVAAPLANAKVDRLFNRIRQDTGQQTVSRRGALRKLLRTLREGGNVGLLLDQNTKPSAGGLFVDFFGLPVPMSGAVGALRQHTGARVLFMACLPDGRGGYPVVRAEPLDLSAVERRDPEAVRRITAEVARCIEARVRRRPGAWLWMYKRWKYVPPGRPSEEYPFYARLLRPAEIERLERTREQPATAPGSGSEPPRRPVEGLPK